MARHYTIYKYNPATKERTILHEKVPEAMADWLCRQSERELSKREKERGLVVVKEPSAGTPPRRKTG